MYFVSMIRLAARASRAGIAALVCAALAAGCTPVQTGNAIPSEQARVAFQSQCAQNVIECTSSWPTAVATIAETPGLTVTETDEGFLVRSGAAWGGVEVSFVGGASDPGEGATSLSYSWSFGASDEDPCVLAPGTEFSTDADPTAVLAPGFHYVRLTVENDIIREEVLSNDCGVIGTNIASFDFVEIEIEVQVGY